MRLLIDTHIFLWWMKGDKNLRQKTIDRINNAERAFVSSISLFEIHTKKSIGKLDTPDSNLYLGNKGFAVLPFTYDHSESARMLTLHHRDPFDRMLIAQAKHEKLAFVTHDEDIWKYHKDIAILKA